MFWKRKRKTQKRNADKFKITHSVSMRLRKILRYRRGNKKPNIEEGQQKKITKRQTTIYKARCFSYYTFTLVCLLPHMYMYILPPSQIINMKNLHFRLMFTKVSH